MNRSSSSPAWRRRVAWFAGLTLATTGLAQDPAVPATAGSPDPLPPSAPAVGAPAVLPPPVLPAPTVGASSTGGMQRLPARLRPTFAPNRTAGAAPATTPGVPPPGVPGGAPNPAGRPPGQPGAPGASGAPAEGAVQSNLSEEEARNLADDETTPAQFLNMPLDQALGIFANLQHRVLLKPPQLAGGPINLDCLEQPLTRAELIEAMNAVFALNNISVIPVGEKFLKVVPSQQAVQEGAKTSDLPTDQLSELGQFVTKLVKVTKVKPGDIAQAVQQFASSKVQNPVLVFDDQNFFILRDMAANVKRMTELIKELDVTPELDYKLEVIPIRYGKVEEIFDTLNSVVTGSPGSGGTGGASRQRASGFRSGATGSTTGLGNTGLGATSGLTPNATGTARSGMTTPGAARSGFADRLRQVSSSAAGGGGNQYNLLADARIIPDMRSNSLLVYANKEDFKMLTNIVAKIDTLLAQVLIESIILEVGLDKTKDFGFSMANNPQKFGNWSQGVGSINKASLATNTFGSGFSYLGQYKDDFSVAMTAIATDSNAKVLARPRIQTTHAQQAQFEIGDTVPYPRSSSPYYGGVGGGLTPYTTYDEKKVTTRLMVTPYITPDGLVTLEVEQVIDQLGPPVTVGQDQVPTIRTRSASAVLSVRDGQPVILGGFITDRKTEGTSGVPWLKDIPLLGWAFRSKSDTGSRTELIVLIRPTVLNTPQEASNLAELEKRSLPNAAAAAREFQQKESEMAEKLGVVPGSTNLPPDAVSGDSDKNSRKKRKR